MPSCVYKANSQLTEVADYMLAIEVYRGEGGVVAGERQW